MSWPVTYSAGQVAYRGPSGAIYLNLTNRCSSSCEFCLREWSDSVYGASLRLDGEPEAEEVVVAIEMECLDGPATEVVFCGFGEPTMRLDVVLAVTEWLRLRRIRTRLDTNGHASLLNPGVDVPAALAATGLNVVTVSLNAADSLTYDRVCKPVFAKTHRAVIRFAEECLQQGIETTMTTVDYPGGDVSGCAAIAERIGAGFRVRALATPRGGSKGDMT